MKTFKKHALLLACCLLSASCEKIKLDANGLPSATQEGKNTLGCLINGKAFIAKEQFLTKSAITCKYGYIENDIAKGYHLDIFGSDHKSNKKTGDASSVALYINKIDIQEGGTYQLQNQKGIGVSAEYHTFMVFHDYISLKGELTITKFDLINNIASGTFWFDAENDKGEKVELRKGRFDVKIINNIIYIYS